MKAIQLSMFFSLMGVFCASTSIASSLRCEEVLSPLDNPVVHIEMAEEVLNRGLKPEDFARTVSEINKLLGPLEVPYETKIFIDTDYAKSNFSPLRFSIRLGIHPETGRKLHPNINQAILAHEYGHAVFEKNLLKHSEPYQTLLQEGRENAADIKNHPENYAVFFRKWALVDAYHELFADVLALVHSQDPQAIKRGVVMDTIEPKKKNGDPKEHSVEDLKRRDFSAGRHHLNWKTWQKSQRVQLSKGDIYYAFLPARWELWKEIRSQIKSSHYQKTVLPKVFAILERHLSQALRKPSEQWGAKRFHDIENVNEQLSQDFRRDL